MSAPVSSSSQSKKKTHSLQWVLLEKDLVLLPTFEGRDTGSISKSINSERAWNGPELPFYGLLA